MPIQSRWSRSVQFPPPPVVIEAQPAASEIAPLVPAKRDILNGGRPARKFANAEVVAKGRRQVTSFYLHGEMYDRMKSYLRSVNLSQTEWLEYLIRTELARRGFGPVESVQPATPPVDQPPTRTNTAAMPAPTPATNPAPSPAPAKKPAKPRKRKKSSRSKSKGKEPGAE